MTALPKTIDGFCNWCTEWIRNGAGDADGLIKPSWIVAGEKGVIYGPLPAGDNDEFYRLAGVRLAEAIEEHRPEFFAIVLAAELGPGSEEAGYPPGDVVMIVAHARDEERHLLTRDGKSWQQVANPVDPIAQVGRIIAAEWWRVARYDERQEMIAHFANPLLDRLADEALEAVVAPGERVAKTSRLVELAAELAAALPKAKQKKLVRLADQYLQAWSRSPASFESAVGRTNLVALLISQVAGMRLEAAGLRAIVIEAGRYGPIAVLHRATADPYSFTESELEQLVAED